MQTLHVYPVYTTTMQNVTFKSFQGDQNSTSITLAGSYLAGIFITNSNSCFLGQALQRLTVNCRYMAK